MVETQNVAEELQQETQTTTAPIDLGSVLWEGKEPIVVSSEQSQIEPTTTPTVETQETTETPTIDYSSFVKETFGFETVESAKEEIENLKKLKDQKPQFEFSNEDSRKLYEAFTSGKEDDIYSYLSKKKEVERLSNAEVNEQTALDILKLSLKSKNEDLTNDEVNFLLKKQYSVPKEPTQKVDELDEDFESRHNEWKEIVDEKKQELIINAKLAKKEIEQFKSNIVLPTLEKEVTNKVDPKVLEQQEQLLKDFQSELNQTYKSYQGVNVTAKCEDAEFLLSFAPKESEKESLKTTLNEFGLEEYFNPRWLTQEGKVNTSKMMDDIYWLENKEAILQKVANESAAQMSLFIKQKNSNLKLNTTAPQSQTFNPQGDKSPLEKLSESMWK
jgi:hypothetical protein